MLKKFLMAMLTIVIILVASIGSIYYFFLRDTDFIDEKEMNITIGEDAFLQNPYSGFARLNEDEKKAYIRISNSLEERISTVEMKKNAITVEGLDRVWKAIHMDKPEIFWMDSYTYKYDQETGVVSDVNFAFFYDSNEIDRRKSEIDLVVANIKANITADMDDYQKVKTVHDYIVKSTEYDLSAADNQNICSVFLGKRSVCAGYSKALQYVLKDLGIFSSYVTGNAAGRGPHAWNLVQMNGEYYYVDVTWDDPSFDTAATKETPPVDIEYVYFGLTTEELSLNHSFDNYLGEYPVFNATAANYYVREKKLYDLYDASGEEAFMAELRKTLLKGTVLEVRFTEPGMITKALSLIEKSDLLYGRSISYLRYEENHVLILWRG